MVEVSRLHVASRASIHKSALIFYHRYFNKLKNDLRLLLTSLVKELEQITKNWWIWINSGRKNETNDGLASNWRCGWRPSTLTSCWTCGLCTSETNETKFVFSQELEKWEKKAALISVKLVKRKLLKEYNMNKLNKYNIINHV